MTPWREDPMNRTKRLRGHGRVVGAALVIAVFIFGLAPSSFAADDRQEAEQLVEKAKFTLDDFMSDKNMDAFHDLLKRAKGIFIAPQVLKGAFIIGASGGTGVLFAWDEKEKSWAGPAFDTVGGASFGFQIGGQASEVILLAMTDRGVTAFLSNSLKLGADVGVAAGPVGAGVAASSANLSADILTFARSKGLYGGVSLDGAVMAVRGSLNDAYYGRKVTPTDILVRRDVSNPQAAGLLQSVRKATGK
jgi:SH3 domain-containing YSC84-like protein 1